MCGCVDDGGKEGEPVRWCESQTGVSAHRRRRLPSPHPPTRTRHSHCPGLQALHPTPSSLPPTHPPLQSFLSLYANAPHPHPLPPRPPARVRAPATATVRRKRRTSSGPTRSCKRRRWTGAPAWSATSGPPRRPPLRPQRPPRRQPPRPPAGWPCPTAPWARPSPRPWRDGSCRRKWLAVEGEEGGNDRPAVCGFVQDKGGRRGGAGTVDGQRERDGGLRGEGYEGGIGGMQRLAGQAR